jgi:hypothetical protein
MPDMGKNSKTFMRSLIMALFFFKAIAGIAIASNVSVQIRNPNEDIAKKFVHLAFHVSEPDIKVQQIGGGDRRYGGSGYNALVYVQDKPSYVFKSGTGVGEIKFSKRLK